MTITLPYIQVSAEQAYGFAMDSPLFQKRRPRSGHHDWTGGQEDVGLMLRKNGWKFPGNDDDDSTFGIYLGRHGNGYVVATKKLMSLRAEISGGQAFESIEELKMCWELD